MRVYFVNPKAFDIWKCWKGVANYSSKEVDYLVKWYWADAEKEEKSERGLRCQENCSLEEKKTPDKDKD